MSAIRLPLLYAFAGGCLSTAILFGVWQAGAESGAAAVKQQQLQQQRAHHVELASASLVAPSEESRPAPANDIADREANTAAEPAAAQARPDSDSAGPSAANSAAVSDVLTRLETAYRERVASSAPLPPATTEQPSARSAPPPDSAAPAMPEPSAPSVAALAPVEAAPPPPVSVAAAEVAPPAPVPIPAAPTAAPNPPVAPTEPPQYAASPAFAPPDAPPPTEIHYGDVNQNTYITNVRQGDLYVVQMQQQLAMMQYLQLLGMSGAAAARNGRGPAARQISFPSTITNPDNPWGFNFKPPHLVH